MAETKNLPSKTSYSPLSRALRSDDVVLAVKLLSTVSPTQIMVAREERDDLVFQLEGMRRSYKYFKKNMVPDRIVHMATLKKLGEQLKAELAEIPEVPTMFELRMQDDAELQRVLCLLVISLVEFHDTKKI